VEWESLIVRIVPILAFLVCITIVAELADGLGVFTTLARGAARLAAGSVLGLWLLIVAIAVTSTAVLSLDMSTQALSSRPGRALPPCSGLGGAARPALRCPGGASPRVALLVPLLLAASVTVLWLAHR
jgi:hypothetical protein